MLKIVAGLLLGFLIGAACRWFDVPTPSPPSFLGAALVVSLTLGYVTVDRILAPRAASASATKSTK